MKYTQVYDNEWIEPLDGIHKIVCCDCGLVHKIEFAVVNGKVRYKAVRDKRATAQRRRGLKRRIRPVG